MRWFEWDIRIEHDQMVGDSSGEASAVVGHHCYWVYLRRNTPLHTNDPWEIEVEEWPLSWDENVVTNPARTIHTEEVPVDQGYARFADLLEKCFDAFAE